VNGVWVAYQPDGSSFVPFDSELEAYRFASLYMMTVKFVRFGDEDWQRSEQPEPHRGPCRCEKCVIEEGDSPSVRWEKALRQMGLEH
jgi:hypothetical protein